LFTQPIACASILNFQYVQEKAGGAVGGNFHFKYLQAVLKIIADNTLLLIRRCFL